MNSDRKQTKHVRFERLEDDVSFSTPGWWGWGGSTISSSENVFMSCLIMSISRSQQVTADCVSFWQLISICVGDSISMSQGRIWFHGLTGDISRLVTYDDVVDPELVSSAVTPTNIITFYILKTGFFKLRLAFCVEFCAWGHTPKKTNMNTQHDGLEKVSPFKHSHFCYWMNHFLFVGGGAKPRSYMIWGLLRKPWNKDPY